MMLHPFLSALPCVLLSAQGYQEPTPWGIDPRSWQEKGKDQDLSQKHLSTFRQLSQKPHPITQTSASVACLVTPNYKESRK